jgi:hypothetical protein
MISFGMEFCSPASNSQLTSHICLWLTMTTTFVICLESKSERRYVAPSTERYVTCHRTKIHKFKFFIVCE